VLRRPVTGNEWSVREEARRHHGQPSLFHVNASQFAEIKRLCGMHR
jgi:hypothetical protein